jgi:restriction endonuclease S subunit
LEGRFEPKFYTDIYVDNENKLNNSKYKINSIQEVTSLVSDGTHFTPKYKDSGIKFISVKNVRKSEINFSNTKYISKKEADKLDSRCKPTYGDILLTKVGSIGRAATICTDERFQIFVSVALLRPNNKLSSKYLEIALNLNCSYLQYDRVVKGSGVPDLHLEDIRKIKIPIPPKNIQADIVAKMDKAYQDKKDKETQAQNLLNSIDDYLLDELGIDFPKQTDNSLKARIFTKKLSEVVGGRFDAEYYQNKYIDFENSLIEKGGYIFLKELLQMLESGSRPTGGVGNIESGILSFGGTHVSSDGYIDTSKAKYIPIEYHQKNLTTTTKINDLLLVKDGATTGKIAIIQKLEHESQNINEHVFLMRLKNNVNPIYLLSYLKSSFGNMQIKREITGATVTGLTKDVVNSLKIPLPPIEKQNQIAKRISKIRDQAKQLQTEAKNGLEQAKHEVEIMILKG